ncbi:MAG: ABC transporter ATP-binding protein/permease [Acetobacteraceae bacterium]|nr:ABC transporter ATP-binding protein/permease [Acetobacteraceae bacterium]
MNGVGEFLKDTWRLARPYFVESEERWSARGLLVAVIGLALASVGLTVLLNFWRAEFYNALQNKDWDGFVNLILTYRRTENGFTFGFTPLAFLYVTIAIYEIYLTQWLQIRWRRWLTVRFLDRWMADRAYYKIGLTGTSHDLGTDNPDQRIAEDIKEFCDTSLSLTLGLISRIVSLLSFLTILWGLSGAIELLGVTIPGYLFWIALIYAIAGTVFTHLVGRPLAALNFRQQRVEADFRYSLVRIRENVEGIALYRGENEEKVTLFDRFGALIGNFRAIMTRTKLLNMVTVGYSQAAAIFPIVIIAPRYFAGKVTLGVLFQTTEAFGRVESALSWIINVYSTLASWRAVVGRLSTFDRAIDAARAVDGNLIRVESGDGALHVHGLDLSLPDGTKLLENADLILTPGHSVVVTGRSGSGKSTLFRVLSGIWPFARGEIQVPANMFFLPQRPYIPLGTLRRVVTYPNDPALWDRAAIAGVLHDVGLDHLIDRIDRDDNWPQSLSGGEQQRVAVARALLAQPSWIFLDEATASLDAESETALYKTLKTHLPDATLVSIAHRPSVAGFHEGRVVFRREGTAPGTLIQEASP